MTTVFVGDQQVLVSGQTGIITLAAGLTGAAAQITREAFITVVNVTRASDSHAFLILPTDSEVGDVVELYQDLSLLDWGPIAVRTPSGENFGDADSGDIKTQVGVGYGARLRKLTETQWGIHGNNNV